MPPELRSIFPETNSPATEIFQISQTTQEFYQEVKYRENFQNYCQWYYKIAEQHQKELQKMRSDINILGFFLQLIHPKVKK
ncbi:MAG: hypothetical protein F6K25_23770 [Okeania sp. SIO2G4]|uniref:hypothetical protein n=1 Tax=unclassified Okeania TaxID=2634635 RepID=UPI0013BE0761|nr:MULTISPECIES: hypothetical protein [unclassified Okeania]NEP04712.1 hypothetical protein [Okeania sp. SIO4D6]NEP39098.1 hypothetical protein [Okeania sp. SIO2H7]NEP74656.1 hypothetical protein [Okeania sp. SIO2G5]NEP95717.1 hypothetical protein [Okeania sp. SIO2F5]NEQ93516.1 hypothetical protein [Okeania sp. SIO2G4]